VLVEYPLLIDCDCEPKKRRVVEKSRVATRRLAANYRRLRESGADCAYTACTHVLVPIEDAALHPRDETHDNKLAYELASLVHVGL